VNTTIPRISAASVFPGYDGVGKAVLSPHWRGSSVTRINLALVKTVQEVMNERVNECLALQKMSSRPTYVLFTPVPYAAASSG
jgi:hypothetical protein